MFSCEKSRWIISYALLKADWNMRTIACFLNVDCFVTSVWSYADHIFCLVDFTWLCFSEIGRVQASNVPNPLLNTMQGAGY